MSTAALDKLIWSLIFGGLIVFGIGFAVERNDAVLGWSLVVAGGVAAVAGALLVVLRSRIADGP